MLTHIMAVGKDNRADAPSRDELFCGTRLVRTLFPLLWGNPCGVLTRDAFSSLATAVVPPGWGTLPEPGCYLPYFAIGPDPHSIGTDCFAQEVCDEFCYVNPPFCMCKAAVLFFVGSRARGLFVLPNRSGEWWWDAYVSGGGFCQWSVELPVPNTEYRATAGDGWRVVDKPIPLRGYVLDFRAIPPVKGV